jgi:type III secretory pathway component EscS
MYLVLHRRWFVVGMSFCIQLTMMGFHAVTQWQNETFHFLYHMNIITLTHFNSRMGKKEAKNTSLGA